MTRRDELTAIWKQCCSCGALKPCGDVHCKHPKQEPTQEGEG